MRRPGLRRIGRWSTWLLVAALLAACARGEGASQRYHCPMHPTYLSDRQGDCPICGMRLVPIAADKAGAPATSAPSTACGDGACAAPEAGEATSHAAYVCPMHCPGSDSDEPRKCPVCGMALVANPKAAAGAVVEGRAAVPLTSEGVRLAGVQTAVAASGSLTRTVRAVGVVTVDERRVRQVHTKISGWVDRLYVDFTGQVVAKGQPLLALYSQELLAGQEEYLRAREAAARFEQSSLPEVRKGGQDLVTAARRRLELFDVPPGFVAAIGRAGKPQRAVPVLSPVAGVVTAKGVFEGQQVDPSTELFTVTDLSRVWIEASVFENEAGLVRVGQPATLALVQEAPARRQGTVTFVAPTLDPDTRTLKVRFEFDNPDLALRPGLAANVELPLEAADGVVVPDSAVLDSGLRQLVFVKGTDGGFLPREVRVGLRTDGKAQVVSGLAAGDEVAVRANFLLDAESRLRDAIAP